MQEHLFKAGFRQLERFLWIGEKHTGC